MSCQAQALEDLSQAHCHGLRPLQGQIPDHVLEVVSSAVQFGVDPRSLVTLLNGNVSDSGFDITPYRDLGAALSSVGDAWRVLGGPMTEALRVGLGSHLAQLCPHSALCCVAQRVFVGSMIEALGTGPGLDHAYCWLGPTRSHCQCVAQGAAHAHRKPRPDQDRGLPCWHASPAACALSAQPCLTPATWTIPACRWPRPARGTASPACRLSTARCRARACS